ncbi:hypothetical protein NDU88_010078 [Pleurodeles waltl]|uniref:Uncharacterized protein n=1 Tax=Pleurodeles waltl TaxID=8319 RepID=A0AAV7PUP6_PLEWA|nr:hypothetical protein NDU88_010078 [Pleurodeles waltl]
MRRRRARRACGCRRAPVSGGVHRRPLRLSRFSLSGLTQRRRAAAAHPRSASAAASPIIGAQPRVPG